MENPRREIVEGDRSGRRGGADGNSYRERDEGPTGDDLALRDDADPGKRFRTRGWLPLHRGDRGPEEGCGPDRVLHGPRCAAGIQHRQRDSAARRRVPRGAVESTLLYEFVLWSLWEDLARGGSRGSPISYGTGAADPQRRDNCRNPGPTSEGANAFCLN